MNYQKKTVKDIDVRAKRVLLRCDFNVPQDKKTGEITSDKRIVAALPTIRYLLDQGRRSSPAPTWESPPPPLRASRKSNWKRARPRRRSLRTPG